MTSKDWHESCFLALIINKVIENVFSTRMIVVDHTYAQSDWHEWQGLVIKRYYLCVSTSLVMKWRYSEQKSPSAHFCQSIFFSLFHPMSMGGSELGAGLFKCSYHNRRSMNKNTLFFLLSLRVFQHHRIGFLFLFLFSFSFSFSFSFFLHFEHQFHCISCLFLFKSMLQLSSSL